MHRIFYMGLDAALAGILLVPIFLVVNKHYFHSKNKMVSYLLFALYLSAVYSVAGLPSIACIRVNLRFNLVPFAYMFSDYMNSLLNVALFVPLGFFLPVLWKNFKNFSKTLLFGFCVSLLIELLQIFTLRATDINDLMTNTLGTVIGWCMARLLLKLIPSIAPSWKTQDIYLISGIAFSVMFFVHPFLTDLIELLLR